MIASLLVGSALLVLFSPWMLAHGARLLSGDLPHVSTKPSGTTYQESMADLANVRKRLLQTSLLDDKAKAAIDALTLALVAGSDQ